MSDRELTLFSIRLKELREEKNLTQVQLADILGTSKQSVWNYEASHREPNIEMLKVIAKCFNVTVDYLIGNDEYKNEVEKTLIDGISEKISMPKEFENDVVYLVNNFLDIMKLSIYSLLPPGSTEKTPIYADTKILIKGLESITVWLRDYMFQALIDVEDQYKYNLAIEENNLALIDSLEKKISTGRHKEFFHSRFNHSITTYIDMLQGEYKKILNSSIKEKV